MSARLRHFVHNNMRLFIQACTKGRTAKNEKLYVCWFILVL